MLIQMWVDPRSKNGLSKGLRCNLRSALLGRDLTSICTERLSEMGQPAAIFAHLKMSSRMDSALGAGRGARGTCVAPLCIPVGAHPMRDVTESH